MSISAEKYDALVAAGNYFFIEGYNCQIGPYIVHNMDEAPLVKRQIERYNTLLKLLMETWRVLPYVVNVNGKPAVFVTRDVDTLFETLPFPHERFAALIAATERVAQDVANPEASEDKYLAPGKSEISKVELLAIARVPESVIREVLPSLSLHQGDGVDIVIQQPSGDTKTLVLPRTEDVRKPPDGTDQIAVKHSEFEGVVQAVLIVHGLLLLDDGTLVEPTGSVEAFVAGSTYYFCETAPRYRFSKEVRRASLQTEQHDIFVPH